MNHRDSLCYDLLLQERQKLYQPSLYYSDHIYNDGLVLIDQLLQQNGKSLKSFNNMCQLPTGYHNQFSHINYYLINNQLSYDTEALKKIVDINVAKFNREQLIVYNAVISSLRDKNNSSRIMFIDGPGVNKKIFY